MKRIALFTLATLFFIACDNAMQPVDDELALVPLFSEVDDADDDCPTPADVVVTDNAGLDAALLAATSGDVIGIDGVIVRTAGFLIKVAGVTLTCATAGSGLSAGVGFVHSYLFRVDATDVTIDRLTLDATNTSVGAVLTRGGSAANGIRFTNNIVYAGPFFGVQFRSTEDAVIADNYIENASSTGMATGLYLWQAFGGAVDRSVVTGNVVVTLVPTGTGRRVFHAGIRVRDGKEVVVSDNHVEGPWRTAFGFQNLSDSEFERNEAEGSQNFGFALTMFRPDNRRMVDNVFRDNSATEIGSAASTPPFGHPPAGFRVHKACNNTFIGNDLEDNFNDVGAIFTVDSGANTMVVDDDDVVVFDDGNLDCDGDGVSDPNIILVDEDDDDDDDGDGEGGNN